MCIHHTKFLLCHVFFNAVSPCLLRPINASALDTFNYYVSACWHPIIRLLTFHMSKPSQSNTSNNNSNTMSSRLDISSLALPSLSFTPHIHLIIILSVLSRLCIHCPRLAAIHQHDLDTSPVNFSFQLQWSPPRTCKDRWEFPKLSPCKFYSRTRGLFSAAAWVWIS
jgi:hypothetical protein